MVIQIDQGGSGRNCKLKVKQLREVREGEVCQLN
jgi:hypothetical protein